jgi:hypothetical protein
VRHFFDQPFGHVSTVSASMNGNLDVEFQIADYIHFFFHIKNRKHVSFAAVVLVRSAVAIVAWIHSETREVSFSLSGFKGVQDGCFVIFSVIVLSQFLGTRHNKTRITHGPIRVAGLVYIFLKKVD